MPNSFYDYIKKRKISGKDNPRSKKFEIIKNGVVIDIIEGELRKYCSEKGWSLSVMYEYMKKDIPIYTDGKRKTKRNEKYFDEMYGLVISHV